jgi:hypothetical protein
MKKTTLLALCALPLLLLPMAAAASCGSAFAAGIARSFAFP